MLIDTHAAVRDLEAAGMDTAQAEAVVKAIARADQRIATRADIDTLRSDIDTLRSDIDTLRSEVRWMIGFLAALILAMAARLFDLV